MSIAIPLALRKKETYLIKSFLTKNLLINSYIEFKKPLNKLPTTRLELVTIRV